VSASTFSSTAGGISLFAQRLEQLLRHPWTPSIVNAVVLVLLCASLAQWTWKLIARTQPSGPPAPIAMPLVKALDVNAITGSNLFGKAEEGKPSLAQIPISSLNIIVSGLMAAGQAGFALVSVSGAPELPVFVGDELMSGVVLESVLPDRILVRRGAVTESLLLKEASPGLAAGSIITGAAVAAPAGNGIDTIAPNNYAVNREWLNQQMTTPDFLKQARIVPNAGGGFLVRNIQPGSLYDKFGLKVGDVIRTVNGKQVNSVTDVMKIYGDLTKSGGGGTVTLSVVRAGRPEQLTYNLQ